jgi:hypothetical protein
VACRPGVLGPGVDALGRDAARRARAVSPLPATKLTWSFAGHDEVYEAGDASYVPAGHTPKADAGSEFVQFSPAEPFRATEEAIMKNVQAMQAQAGA